MQITDALRFCDNFHRSRSTRELIYFLLLCQDIARGKMFTVFPIISDPVKYIHKNAYSFLNSLQLFRHKNCCILSSRHFFAHINMQMKLHISQSDNELINSPPSDPLGRGHRLATPRAGIRLVRRETP